jgi:hypothetical protein
MNILPNVPGKPDAEKLQPPMVYVRQRIQWEYKVLIKELGSDPALDEDELNTLGKQGWELGGVFVDAGALNIVFKRLVE